MNLQDGVVVCVDVVIQAFEHLMVAGSVKSASISSATVRSSTTVRTLTLTANGEHRLAFTRGTIAMFLWI